MSKYIIEIEDVPFSKVHFDADNGAQNINLYKAKGFNALVFDKDGLDKLTPLDKELEEAYQKGFEVGQHEATTQEYQQGLEDMHKAIEKISNMSAEEKEAVFYGQTLYYVINEYTTNGIMERLATYEKQQKVDEIKVGDEVESLSTGWTYIIHEVNEEMVKGYNFKNRQTCYRDKNSFKKTGRYFPQIKELIKAMNGELRNCSTCKYKNDTEHVKCDSCYVSRGYNKWEPEEVTE